MAETAQGDGAKADVLIAVEGCAGVICLNRPRALNALSTEMKRLMAAAYPAFARDPQVYGVILKAAPAKVFSAGSDIRELAGLVRTDQPAADRLLAEEYSLNWLHECFSKPTVSLIDGEVMGAGVGITQYGTHRIAGERYRFSMPETAIGFFPDAGVGHVLARLPHQIGIYLGLTGRSIASADAYWLGLVTHCIPAARFGEIEAAICDADPVDAVLDSRHEDPGVPDLSRYHDVIERCFAAGSVEEIIARLAAETREMEWSKGVLDDLARRAPAALKATLKHLRNVRHLDLRQTLSVDYRLARRMIRRPDFIEGVRAILIDKDQAPVWRPARLEDVSTAMVEDLLAPDPGHELVLATRQEMQAARV